MTATTSTKNTMVDVHWKTVNRTNWDDRTCAHLRSSGGYYNPSSVIAGKSSLLPLEVELAGEIAERQVLHLMCHIGLDSISWARLGAHVTAVDFSPIAITAARRLAGESKVTVGFHEANVVDLPEECNGPFYLIVMTYGVLNWIQDFPLLMRLVSERLEVGGRFILVDGHPLTALWPYKFPDTDFQPQVNNYFSKSQPERFVRSLSYGGGGPLKHTVSYQWQHHVAEIMQSVVDADLDVKMVREEPYGFYRRYPNMSQRSDGYFDPPPDLAGLPLLFALMAERS